MSKTLRVVIKYNGGFALQGATETEREHSRDTFIAMMEKWKSDPGIQFVCYYLQPQVSHCAVFQVDSVSKIDEMDTRIEEMEAENEELESLLAEERDEHEKTKQEAEQTQRALRKRLQMAVGEKGAGAESSAEEPAEVEEAPV